VNDQFEAARGVFEASLAVPGVTEVAATFPLQGPETVRISIRALNRGVEVQGARRAIRGA
jgi:hypothetical protein